MRVFGYKGLGSRDLAVSTVELRSVLTRCSPLQHSMPQYAINPHRHPPDRPEQVLKKAHLVKALQQAHDAALDLLLVERTAGAVKPHTLEALDLGDDDGGGSGAGGSGGDGSESCHGGGSGGDAGDGSEDGGAEHGCGSSLFEEFDCFNWWVGGGESG